MLRFPLIVKSMSRKDVGKGWNFGVKSSALKFGFATHWPTCSDKSVSSLADSNCFVRQTEILISDWFVVNFK